MNHKFLVKERKREKSAGESRRQSRHDLVVHRKSNKMNIFRQSPHPIQGSRKKTGRRKNKRRRVRVGVVERDTRRVVLSVEVVCSKGGFGRGSQRRSQRWGQAWSGGGELLGEGNLKAATRALHGRVGGEAAIRQIYSRSDHISLLISDPNNTLIDFSGLLHLLNSPYVSTKSHPLRDDIMAS